jgi:NADH dehydrogenase [ubiquinone] 1 alpha subcomplex assembly factor 7
MAKASPEIASDIAGALKRLTDSGRGGMGSMFKAIAISDPRLTGIAGLSDQPQEEAEHE